MPYINFKEEVYTAEKQLTRRKRNNENIIKKIKDSYETLNISHDNKFSFRKIDERVINNSKTLKEDEFLEICNEDIVCCHFIKCKFYNIKFVQCTFLGCIFEECDFGGGGVVFENCIFVKEDSIKTPSLNEKDNLSCMFKKCNLYVKFLSSNIAYIILEDCSIRSTSFELSDVRSGIIINSELQKVTLSDCDLSGIKIVGCYLEDFEFNDKYKSKLDEKSFVDKIKVRKKTRDEYEGIYMVYESLANEFEENNLKNNFGEYYFLGRCIQRKSLKLMPKIESYITYITSGYGERIWNPLITSFVLVLIFAVGYLFFGIEKDDDVIIYNITNLFPINFRQLLINFNSAFTLSAAIFTGAGADRLGPLEQSYFLSNTEAIVGVIMLGIGIGTLIRKLVR